MADVGVLDEMRIEVRMDLDKIQAELREIKSSVKQSATESTRAFDDFATKSKRSFSTLKSEIVGLVGAAGLAGLVSSLINTASALADSSAALGVNVVKLQEFQIASKLAGVDAQEFNASLAQFSRRVSEARSGNQQLGEVFYRVFGPGYKQAISANRDLLTIFDDFITRLGQVQNESDRTAVSFDSLGRGGARLVAAAREFDALRARARSSGGIISEKDIQLIDEFGDQWDLLKGRLVAATTPILTAINEVIEKTKQAGHFLFEVFTNPKQPYGPPVPSSILARRNQGPAPLPSQLPASSPGQGTLFSLPLSKEELAERQKVAEQFLELVNKINADAKTRREKELKDLGKDVENVQDLVNKLNEEGKERNKKELEAAAELAKERAQSVKDFSDRVASRILEGGRLSFRRLAESFEQEFLQRALSALINSGLTKALALLGGGSGGAPGGAAALLALKGAGAFAGFFADGGQIPAGAWGIAGENGPERVRGPATVVPGVGGGGGVILQVITDQPSSRVSAVHAGQQGGLEVYRVMVGEMNKAMASGAFDTALRSRFRIQPRTS